MDVFLSYAHEDSEFARRLEADLERSGLSVWSDKSDIQPGENWVRVISEAIENASNFLIVVPRTRQDESYGWGSTEIALAVSSVAKHNEKRLIPIVRDPRSELPSFLRRYQFADLSTESAYEKAIPRLIDQLSKKPRETLPISESQRFAAEEEAIRAEKMALQYEIGEWDKNNTTRSVHIISSVFSAGTAFFILSIVTLILLHTGVFGNSEQDALRAILYGIIGGISVKTVIPRLSEYFTRIVRKIDYAEEVNPRE